MNLKRKYDENEEQFLWRLGQAKDLGLENISWDDIANIVNREFRNDESEFRSEAAYRKPYQQAKRFFEANVFSNIADEDILIDIENKQFDLQKEKMKVRAEKIELNKYLREISSAEIIFENISQAIKELKPLTKPDAINKPYLQKKEYVLLFGDEHYGTEFKITGLYGEIINEYSPEIFEKRMWNLYYKVLEYIQQENIKVLNIFNMGDYMAGILRVSQLMKLRYGVVDATIKYSEFICNWLNELSKKVNIKFQMTNGNHSELRQLGMPKGTFSDDNMGKVVKEFIKIRLKDNLNFTLVENPTGYIFEKIGKNIILGIHGEVKDMDKTLKDFSRIYNTSINYLIGGHLHHSKTEETGCNCEIINIPSIMGIDDYSMELKKTSNAGAKLLVFNGTEGLIADHRIKLNI